VARDLVFASLLAGVASLASWPLYSTPYLAVTVSGGWLVGLGVSFLTATRRWPWGLQALVGVGAALLVGVPLAVPSGTVAGVLPTLSGLGVFVRGLVDAWVQVLSVDPPLGHYDAALVPVLVLAYTGGFAAVRGARAGHRAALVAGPAALLLYGIVFGAGEGFHPEALGAGLLVVSLLWALAVRPRVRGMDAGHARRLRAGAARRTAVGALFAVVCAGGGLALAGFAAPHRAVLRTVFEPAYEVQRQLSPLQSYRSWVTGAAAAAPVATVRGLPAGAMLRVAVMDEYNGVAMQTGNGGASGSFTRLPDRVRRSAPASWHVRVTLMAPQGEWLPLAGRLEAVEVDGDVRDRLYYNKVMDAAVVRDGLGKGAGYGFDAVPTPAPLRTGLGELRPGGARQPDLLQVPEDLVSAARARFASAPTQGGQLQAALDYLHAGGVSHGQGGEIFSRSGHSVERLDILAREAPMVGDAEQYAAAFTVLAREIGFPARVVMGYVDTDGDGTLAGSELTAWVEVQDAARGWVAIDPNPERRPLRDRDSSTQNAIALPRTVLPPERPRQEQSITPQADETPQIPPERPSALSVVLAAIWWWAWRTALVVALLSSPLWLVALVEALRRAARRRGDRRRLSVAGAWNEVRDEAIDAGHGIHPSQTRREVAAASGSGAAVAMAARVDELSFSPGAPSREGIDEVWGTVRSVRRELRGGRSRSQRFRQRYSWRSVGRWLRDMLAP